MASPHTRGWTPDRQDALGPADGFPAHAGMDRMPSERRRCRSRLPRTRGDGPWRSGGTSAATRASPHTRGWTRPAPEPDVSAAGFPAHAGMDPGRATGRLFVQRLPRTRGDGPGSASARRRRCAGFPAHAGMDPAAPHSSAERIRLPRTRGDGPLPVRGAAPAAAASPHTRGWTAHFDGSPLEVRGFPAHAGMDPMPPPTRSNRTWLPRTRGDGPWRACGRTCGGEASPHTRGWTPCACSDSASSTGFPAHAGMDHVLAGQVQSGNWLPRTRGDGPHAAGGIGGEVAASPHTRGWTRRGGPWAPAAGGFPAHAGMDHVHAEHRCLGPGLPRTRGDGPAIPAG